MKRTLQISCFFIIFILIYSCNGNQSQTSSKENNTAVVTEKASVDAPITASVEGKVQHITTSQFVKFVNDFKTSSTFSLKTELPCVIDFYADWCRPCKMISPFLDELAEEYKGKVNFLKVNVDEEPEVASFYQIQAIPAMMFCPKNGDIKMEVGGVDKETINQRIQNYIVKK